MLFEPKIGKLIRKLNPYTNGGMDTMLCGAAVPVIPTVVGPANLNQVLIDYSKALNDYAANPIVANVTPVDTAEGALDPFVGLGDIDLRVDNNYDKDYMTWSFRGQPHGVKRALRFSYRYQLIDKQGNSTGIWVADHVLIGYCGSNGG